MSQAPRVDYQTNPSQYRHWKLSFQWRYWLGFVW